MISSASPTAQTISVRVHPHAKHSAVRGTMADGTLKVDVVAPAEDGRANEELVEVVAAHFGVPQSHVEILSGHTGRRKLVRITGPTSRASNR